MKECPECKAVYGDTLKFCLADGTPLLSFAPRTAETSTSDELKQIQVVFGRAHLYVLAGGILFLAVIAAVVFLRPAPSILASSNAGLSTEDPGPETVRASAPATSYRETNVEAKRRDTSSNPGIRSLTQQITERISAWENAAELRDLDLYMEQYADVVDYYRKTSASKAFIRNDKQRAFSKFSSINIAIDVVSIDVKAGNGLADVIIDKEWLFEGGGHSSGKVRQRISLVRAGEEWLISAEKDLKVFHVAR